MPVNKPKSKNDTEVERSKLKYESRYDKEWRKGLTKEEYFYLTDITWKDVNGGRDYGGIKVAAKTPSVGAFDCE